ncbi:DUF4251 domain-containing protein [Flavobacterium sp. WC2509]|uniref:DUF4251 domain-containing protein n=1 Tax=Flavobacterium sp. WC2509 TaxID=3461406 RepID=UPI004044F6A8
MKTIITTFFLSFFVLIGFAQEKTKKQLKEEKELAKQKEIDSLIESKVFEFVANRANPQGVRSIDMTTNDNFLRLKKDSIHSEMPFFGRGYSGIGYGSGGGLDFKGVVNDFSIKKGKKSYTIKANVKDAADSYNIVLDIYFEGTAYLNINSTHRSSISYNGEIHKISVK